MPVVMTSQYATRWSQRLKRRWKRKEKEDHYPSKGGSIWTQKQSGSLVCILVYQTNCVCFLVMDDICMFFQLVQAESDALSRQ